MTDFAARISLPDDWFVRASMGEVRLQKAELLSMAGLPEGELDKWVNGVLKRDITVPPIRTLEDLKRDCPTLLLHGVLRREGSVLVAEGSMVFARKRDFGTRTELPEGGDPTLREIY